MIRHGGAQVNPACYDSLQTITQYGERIGFFDEAVRSFLKRRPYLERTGYSRINK